MTRNGSTRKIIKICRYSIFWKAKIRLKNESDKQTIPRMNECVLTWSHFSCLHSLVKYGSRTCIILFFPLPLSIHLSASSIISSFHIIPSYLSKSMPVYLSVWWIDHRDVSLQPLQTWWFIFRYVCFSIYIHHSVLSHATRFLHPYIETLEFPYPFSSLWIQLI